jgi:myosin-1
MRTIGLTEAEIQNVIRLLRAILWLGNITFQESHNDQTFLSRQEECDMVSYLLRIDPKQLTYALTHRYMTTGSSCKLVSHSLE